MQTCSDAVSTSRKEAVNRGPRNNSLFAGQWKAPFDLVTEQEFAKGEMRFGAIRAMGAQLLVTRAGGYLACVVSDTCEIVWELERDQKAVISTHQGGGSLFANLSGAYARLDMETGQVAWQTQDSEIVRDTSSNRLFVSGKTGRRPYVGCRDLNSGEVLWQLRVSRGLVAQMVGGDSRAVVCTTEIIELLDAESGSTISTWDCREWCEEHFADRLRERERQPGVSKIPYFSIGPVTRNVIFVSTGIGVVLAMSGETGEILWAAEVAAPNDWAATMISREGTLYAKFHIRPGLLALDEDDGSIAFRFEEAFTPAGCHNPVLLGGLFLGGAGPHLAAMDVESQEMVWRFEYPKPISVFGSAACATSRGFVIPNDETRSLMWFESTS